MYHNTLTTAGRHWTAGTPWTAEPGDMTRGVTVLVKRVVTVIVMAFALTAAPTAAALQLPDAVLDSVATAQTADIAPEQVVEQPSTLTAATPETMWEQANTLYMNGDFAAAAALYERIAAEGLFSAKLYYNLANAYFRTGENTKAILYYNRALMLAPNDEDIRHNLAIAESLTKDSIDEVPEFFLKSWFRTVRNSLDERMWMALSLLFFAAALALGVLFMLAVRTSSRKCGFYGMLAAVVLFIVTTSFAASQRRAMLDREQAIVMSTAAPVKSSPDRAATDLFVLHEGTKVRIVSTVDRWSEVVIADGKKGWIETSKIERI